MAECLALVSALWHDTEIPPREAGPSFIAHAIAVGSAINAALVARATVPVLMTASEVKMPTRMKRMTGTAMPPRLS
jgi:hypothetical protein